MDTPVFDTDILNQFARARWLDVLAAVVGDRCAIHGDARVGDENLCRTLRCAADFGHDRR